MSSETYTVNAATSAFMVICLLTIVLQGDPQSLKEKNVQSNPSENRNLKQSISSGREALC